MSNLTFRGTVLEYPDLRRKEASVFIRVHFSAELTTPVSEAMGWADFPSSITNAKLEGELTCDKFILTPASKKLKDFEIQLQCSRIEDFVLSRVKEDEGDGIKTRLRFMAIVEQVGAIADIENWMRNIGGGEAALKVSYIEQDKLDLKDEPHATDEQRKAAMEMGVN